MRSAATLLAIVLLGALLSGCERTSEDSPMSTTSVVSTTTSARETALGEVSLEADPDAADTELALIVTSNWCSGGLIPAGIDSVDVEESNESIVIEVWIELPVGTWPTTCPANPALEALAPLESPVGDRSVWTHSEQGRVRLWPPSNAGQ